MIDGRETHNFIDAVLVARRGIHTIDFGGFDVVVSSECSIPCKKNILQLDVALGNYTVTNEFYVVEMHDTNNILGV
jgi:hypothetical protein